MEVGRLATGHSRQLSVCTSILENDSVPMPPDVPPSRDGCHRTLLDIM